MKVFVLACLALVALSTPAPTFLSTSTLNTNSNGFWSNGVWYPSSNNNGQVMTTANNGGFWFNGVFYPNNNRVAATAAPTGFSGTPFFGTPTDGNDTATAAPTFITTSASQAVSGGYWLNGRYYLNSNTNWNTMAPTFNWNTNTNWWTNTMAPTFVWGTIPPTVAPTDGFVGVPVAPDENTTEANSTTTTAPTFTWTNNANNANTGYWLNGVWYPRTTTTTGTNGYWLNGVWYNNAVSNSNNGYWLNGRWYSSGVTFPTATMAPTPAPTGGFSGVPGGIVGTPVQSTAAPTFVWNTGNNANTGYWLNGVWYPRTTTTTGTNGYWLNGVWYNNAVSNSNNGYWLNGRWYSSGVTFPTAAPTGGFSGVPGGIVGTPVQSTAAPTFTWSTGTTNTGTWINGVWYPSTTTTQRPSTGTWINGVWYANGNNGMWGNTQWQWATLAPTLAPATLAPATLAPVVTEAPDGGFSGAPDGGFSGAPDGGFSGAPDATAPPTDAPTPAPTRSSRPQVFLG